MGHCQLTKSSAQYLYKLRAGKINYRSHDVQMFNETTPESDRSKNFHNNIILFEELTRPPNGIKVECA